MRGWNWGVFGALPSRASVGFWDSLDVGNGLGSVTHTPLSSCCPAELFPSLKSRNIGHQNPGEGGGERGWKEPSAREQRAARIYRRKAEIINIINLICGGNCSLTSEPAPQGPEGSSDIPGKAFPGSGMFQKTPREWRGWAGRGALAQNSELGNAERARGEEQKAPLMCSPARRSAQNANVPPRWRTLLNIEAYTEQKKGGRTKYNA